MHFRICGSGGGFSALFLSSNETLPPAPQLTDLAAGSGYLQRTCRRICNSPSGWLTPPARQSTRSNAQLSIWTAHIWVYCTHSTLSFPAQNVSLRLFAMQKQNWRGISKMKWCFMHRASEESAFHFITSKS